MDTNMILDTGNTAWMIVATLLVLLMTIPGIALFYGGLVRQKKRTEHHHAVYAYRLCGNYYLGCFRLQFRLRNQPDGQRQRLVVPDRRIRQGPVEGNYNFQPFYRKHT